jgi:hypothetical protein
MDDPIHYTTDVDKLRDIVTMQCEPVMVENLLEIRTAATHHVVDADDGVAVGDQPVTQMAPEESAGAGHHDATHQTNLSQTL